MTYIKSTIYNLRSRRLSVTYQAGWVSCSDPKKGFTPGKVVTPILVFLCDAAPPQLGKTPDTCTADISCVWAGLPEPLCLATIGSDHGGNSNRTKSRCQVALLCPSWRSDHALFIMLYFFARATFILSIEFLICWGLPVPLFGLPSTAQLAR